MSSFVSVAGTSKGIREHLLADPAIVAACGDRVRSSHVEDADQASGLLALGPMLIFELLSGSARSHAVVQGQSFEVWGYSQSSQHEAATVYDLAMSRMHEECVAVPGTGMAGVAREVQRPVSGYNDVLRAWFVRGRWLYSAAGGG